MPSRKRSRSRKRKGSKKHSRKSRSRKSRSRSRRRRTSVYRGRGGSLNTVKQLRKMAKMCHVKNYSKMKKSRLVNAIKMSRGGACA